MIRRVVSASTVGTALEWYDFMLYGTASALVFGRVFFPDSDPTVGTLASLGTFAVGFFARPVGGLLFGHFGDRYGRRLVLMVTLIVMAVSSTLIGLIPTHASIGIAAPALLVLLRIFQGLGAGAEYAGGSLMAAEHAPPGRRGFFAAIPPTGNALGVILAALVFTPFTWLPEDAFLSWGWRIPFLVSILILPVGLYIRFRVDETPAFEKNVAELGKQQIAPLITVVKTAPKSLLFGFLLSVGPNVATYIPSVYALTYITDNVGMAAAVGTIGLMIANTIKLGTLPLSGWLSDRFGRKQIFISGAVLCALAAFPMFWLMDTGNALAVWFAMVVVLTIANDLMLGSQAAMLAEQFDTKVRYTGIAFCRELSAALAGGTLPFIAALLTSRTDGTWAISSLMVVMCVIAIVGASQTKDRRGISFIDDAPPHLDAAPEEVLQSTRRSPAR
ncbi:MHS family MFS transporter [Mycobacterium sp. 21AC1]|uniref:MFS transporter n=1 Tax=[Mycobacterium] appelbergii TaxID=2939269 RepID=UPI002938CF5D|nr:MFS transporter [Mycobacterium sp. 21AC1]MDV3123543.1 MHS family MFS transporter [Mycobacterium sp. 21AC1]